MNINELYDMINKVIVRIDMDETIHPKLKYIFCNQASMMFKTKAMYIEKETNVTGHDLALLQDYVDVLSKDIVKKDDTYYIKIETFESVLYMIKHLYHDVKVVGILDSTSINDEGYFVLDNTVIIYTQEFIMMGVKGTFSISIVE